MTYPPFQNLLLTPETIFFLAPGQKTEIFKLNPKGIFSVSKNALTLEMNQNMTKVW